MLTPLEGDEKLPEKTSLQLHQTGPPGLHTTVRELQTCTFERPGASNTTKIPREDPQRGKKRTNFVAGEGKKARNFGLPKIRAPTLRASPFGPPPFGPHWVWLAPGLHEKTKQLKIQHKNPNNFETKKIF